MIEEIQEQISAFIDDELSAEESAFLVRRLEGDPEARMQFLRYAAIGSAMRGELLHGDSSVLRRRIQASLSGDGGPADLVYRGARRPRLLRATASVGVAAAVAIAALIGLRGLNQPSVVSDPFAREGAGPASDWIEPPSYVVPQDSPGVRVISSPIHLTNYLMQHGNFASILSRTSVHSNVVGVREPDVSPDEVPDGGVSE